MERAHSASVLVPMATIPTEDSWFAWPASAKLKVGTTNASTTSHSCSMLLHGMSHKARSNDSLAAKCTTQDVMDDLEDREVADGGHSGPFQVFKRAQEFQFKSMEANSFKSNVQSVEQSRVMNHRRSLSYHKISQPVVAQRRFSTKLCPEDDQEVGEGSYFNRNSVTEAVSNVGPSKKSHDEYSWRRRSTSGEATEYTFVPHIDQSAHVCPYQERGAPMQSMSQGRYLGMGGLECKKRRCNFFVPRSRYGTISNQNGPDDQSKHNAGDNSAKSQIKVNGDGEELQQRINQELNIVKSKVLNFEDIYNKYIRPLFSSRGLLLPDSLNGSTESWSQDNQSAESLIGKEVIADGTEQLQTKNSDNKKPAFKIDIGDGKELQQRINQELDIVESKVLNFEHRYNKFMRPLLSSRGLLLPHGLKHGSTLFSHTQVFKIMKINPTYLSSSDFMEYEIGIRHKQHEFWSFLKHMVKKRVCVVEDMDNSLSTIQSLMYDHGLLAPEDGNTDEFYKGECDASFISKDDVRLSYIIWKGNKIVSSEVFSIANCSSATEAEAYAAFALLSKAREMKISKLLVCSDCKTVCDILSGEQNIRKHLDHRDRILYLTLRSMKQDFEKLVVMWKPRELMMFADDLAKASDRDISLPLFPEEAMEKWKHHLRGDPVFRIERAEDAQYPRFARLKVDESYARNQDSIFYVEAEEQSKLDCLLGLKEAFEPTTLKVIFADFDCRSDDFKSELEKIIQTRTLIKFGKYTSFKDYTLRDDDADDDADMSGKKRTTLVVVFDASTPKKEYYDDSAFHVLLVAPDEKKVAIENGVPEINALTFVYFNGVRFPLNENKDAVENEMSVKEEQRERKAKQKKEEANPKNQETAEEDLALKEMTDATAREEPRKAMDKEKLCNIRRALAVLASASSVSKERQEFLSIVNKEIELYNSMLEKGGADDEEAKKEYFAARKEPDHDPEVDEEENVSSVLIEKVDAMLQELEKEIDDVDEQIGNRLQLLDRDHDGKVTPEEVAAAAAYLKDTIRKEGVQELISNLSKDKEGKILVEGQPEENNEKEESRQ